MAVWNGTCLTSDGTLSALRITDRRPSGMILVCAEGKKGSPPEVSTAEAAGRDDQEFDMTETKQ